MQSEGGDGGLIHQGTVFHNSLGHISHYSRLYARALAQAACGYAARPGRRPNIFNTQVNMAVTGPISCLTIAGDHPCFPSVCFAQRSAPLTHFSAFAHWLSKSSQKGVLTPSSTMLLHSGVQHISRRSLMYSYMRLPTVSDTSTAKHESPAAATRASHAALPSSPSCCSTRSLLCRKLECSKLA